MTNVFKGYLIAITVSTIILYLICCAIFIRFFFESEDMQIGAKSHVYKMFCHTLKMRSFLAVMGANTCAYSCFGFLCVTPSILYAYHREMEYLYTFSYISFVLFLCFLAISIPFWRAAANRFGTKHTALIGPVISVVALACKWSMSYNHLKISVFFVSALWNRGFRKLGFNTQMLSFSKT